jgi:FkbM family methyltransferase
MRVLKNLLRTVLPDGLMLRAQALDHYLNGEPEVRLISQLCTTGRDAIDAGANIGTYTYFFRRHARNVYAYEPNPSLAARLQRLLPDVKVRNLALSDTDGEVVLQVPIDSLGRQRHELASIAQAFEGPHRDFAVRKITLDSENFDNIGFLKVDVEQHERQVLRGALQTIRRCRPVIMTECTPLKYEADLQTVFGFILQANYVGWCSFAGGWLPFDRLVPERHLNPGRFGRRDGFIGNNILFFPAEHGLARTGPSR